MAYKPYKMRGHTLPGIKQRESSPAKQKDVHPEERKTVDIRPKKGFKESEAKRVEGEKYTGTRSKGGLKPLTDKERVQKKSPAKIAPLIAMAGKALIGSAVSGMMKKKEEE